MMKPCNCGLCFFLKKGFTDDSYYSDGLRIIKRRKVIPSTGQGDYSRERKVFKYDTYCGVWDWKQKETRQSETVQEHKAAMTAKPHLG